MHPLPVFRCTSYELRFGLCSGLIIYQSNCLFDSQSEVVSARRMKGLSPLLIDARPLWLSDILNDDMPKKH